MPIILHIKRLYKHIYQTSNSLDKRNKLGIYKSIENLTLETLLFSINAALKNQNEKINDIQNIRRNIEALKHIIRLAHEISIIKDSTYLAQAHLLQDISMMATGWYKSTQNRH